MATPEMFSYDEPVFIISVAARMLGVRTQTLRYYERLGLIEPARSRGNQRVFSRRDIERVQRIRDLMDDLGVNLAGVEVVIRLLERLHASEAEIERITAENRALHAQIRPPRRHQQRTRPAASNRESDHTAITDIRPPNTGGCERTEPGIRYVDSVP